PNRPLVVILGRPGTVARVVLIREVLEASPETYKSLLKKSIGAQVEGYRELGEERVNRDGLDGSKVVLSFKADNVPSRSWLMIFSKATNHFRIGTQAPEEYFERYQSEFQQLFDSVEFSALAPPSTTDPTAVQYAGTSGRITTTPAAEVERSRAKVA
ncbi:MAG: hypothetical protein ACREYF_04710, partial [Gammaproteobacteria bacterium]